MNKVTSMSQYIINPEIIEITINGVGVKVIKKIIDNLFITGDDNFVDRYSFTISEHIENTEQFITKVIDAIDYINGYDSVDANVFEFIDKYSKNDNIIRYISAAKIKKLNNELIKFYSSKENDSSYVFDESICEYFMDIKKLAIVNEFADSTTKKLDKQMKKKYDATQCTPDNTFIIDNIKHMISNVCAIVNGDSLSSPHDLVELFYEINEQILCLIVMSNKVKNNNVKFILLTHMNDDIFNKLVNKMLEILKLPPLQYGLKFNWNQLLYKYY